MAEALNGSSSNISAIGKCAEKGRNASMHYMATNDNGMDVLNVFSDGTVLLIQSHVVGDRSAFVYRCQECYSEVIGAIGDGQELVQQSRLYGNTQDNYYFEYYDLTCDGEQVNGWSQWNTDTNDTPPWLIFRQAIVKVISEAASKGEVISEQEYIQGLTEKEKEYSFRSITDTNWIWIWGRH